jgi:hypothetical protein
MNIIIGGTNDCLHLTQMHLMDNYTKKRYKCNGLETKAFHINFYIHGSAHRELNLITVQQNATYSVYYISVGSSTYIYFVIHI